MTGNIHSFETFGTVDGPGIRFVVFMQGCPMRCKYCHNPDTWSFSGGKRYTAEQVAENVLKYKNYYVGGGVTVSGGEPLVQAEFVTELFALLRGKGIHTALDTSGITFDPDDCANTARHRAVLENTDLVLLDIKHIDSAAHAALTGHDNARPLAFAKFVSDCGVDMWIRHVLVTGVTDDSESLKKLGAFINTLKTVKKSEVLPYHGMGEVKYEKAGIAYPYKGMQPPSEDKIAEAKKLLAINGGD